ncbi:MAG: lysophospholipid acyltransferase family protein [Nitratireductor sp.]
MTHTQIDTKTNSDIDFSYASSGDNAVQRGFIRCVEFFTGQRALKKHYISFSNLDENEKSDFFDEAISKLELDVCYDANKLNAIPKNKSVIFIANHPYGVLDGIVFTWLAKKVRKDVKVMANHVLCQAPEAQQNLLPVDFSKTRLALETNIATRKQAISHLKTGGAVGIFPAGGVGAAQKPFSKKAADLAWHAFLAKLILKADTSNLCVVPMYFTGQNSRFFQISSHISYTMRLALYFRETYKHMGSRIEVEIGDPIDGKQLSAYENKEALIAGLRKATFDLAANTVEKHKQHEVSNLHEQEFKFPDRFGFN